MLCVSKYARPLINLFTQSVMLEVCSEVCSEQSPFTQSSVLGAHVSSVILGASKFARSNRLLKSCSEHRSMHGATIYSDVLGASRVCMNRSFFNNVRPNFGQLSFPLLFSISAIKMRISVILWCSKHARDILFSSTRIMLRSKCEHAH